MFLTRATSQEQNVTTEILRKTSCNNCLKRVSLQVRKCKKIDIHKNLTLKGLPSKLCAQPPSQNSHAHPYKVEQNWRQMAQLAKHEDFGFQGTTSFGGSCKRFSNYFKSMKKFSARSYLGGPNVTPTYNKITGELLQSNKSESSSSNSESDSSPTHSHTGAFEPSKK